MNYQPTRLSVVSPEPVLTPPRPVIVPVKRRDIPDSQALQELIDILKDNADSEINNH